MLVYSDFEDMDTRIENIVTQDVSVVADKSDFPPTIEELEDSNKTYSLDAAVLFIDIRHSTELMENNKAETMVKIYRAFMRAMADMKAPIEKIRKYAKTLKRYEVREIMAKIERSYGNIDEAIAIYKDLAAEEDSEQWATHNWHMELKEIYKELGDDANYRTEVRAAMRLSAGDMALWKEYKGFFGPDEWLEECAKIFESFKLGDCRPFPWYAAENRYELIMESLETMFNSFSFKEYEKKLKALFPERCLAVLVDDTELKAENSKKRSDYRRVASNLRWIQRYPGGDEVAAKMAADYRERYKLRRAMMEELAEF